MFDRIEIQKDAIHGFRAALIGRRQQVAWATKWYSNKHEAEFRALALRATQTRKLPVYSGGALMPSKRMRKSSK